MKKIKQPGDNFSLKTKKSEDPLVMEWINAQSNLMDSFRYLIENEIVRNGVRNLQAYIPTERNMLNSSSNVVPNVEAYTEQAAGIANDPEPEAAPEDEFDEEDIESWI